MKYYVALCFSGHYIYRRDPKHPLGYVGIAVFYDAPTADAVCRDLNRSLR